ncbi:hypothetical protein [Spirillospora sp. NPDC048819]|uniref:hypothetical protein n=1 Tax=Spirillospora sp. NPDC048819 TaxID=3155268 RepID=UPI0033E4CBFF
MRTVPGRPSAAPDASEELAVLMLRSQLRSDERAAALLEQMAVTDPQMCGYHLAAAARFRERAELCRDLLYGKDDGGRHRVRRRG